MKNILSNSKVTMIISLCLAFFLWYYVSVVLNPDIEIGIRGIPVVYSDMQQLSNRNLAVINDQDMKIDVRVRGDRRTLKQINNKNITAVIDLKEYAGEGEYEIPITIKLPVEGVKLVSKSQQSIKVTVDRIATATVEIKADIQGTPRAGYVWTNELISEKKAIIRGPQSIIKTVSTAVAPLDVSGASSSVSALVDVVLMSANNVQVSSDLVEITPSKVEAMCTVGFAKTVKVVVPILNDEEKRLTASPTEYKEVTLVGEKSVLSKINSVDTEPINALNGYYERKENLALMLPEGTLTQSGIKVVEVQVDVVKP